MADRNTREFVNGAVPRGRIEPLRRAGSPNRALRRLIQRIGPAERFAPGGEECCHRASIQDVERRLVMALEAGKMGIWEVDLVSGEFVWSERLHHLLDLPEDVPLTREVFRSAIHPKDVGRAQEAVRRAVEDTGWLELEFRTPAADGSIRWMQSRGDVICDETGRRVRMVGVTFDVTERRRIEDRLLNSEAVARARLEEIEAIYNSAHVGLCVFDRQLRFLRMNDRLAEINGVPAAEHLGRTPREVVPGLADAAEELAERVFATGEPLLDIEVKGETPAQPGVPRVWVEHWIPLKDGAGQVSGINVVAEEVTEQRRTQRSLAASEQRYRAIFENVAVGMAEIGLDGRFLHVNNTLCTITGYSREELLERTITEVTHPEDVAWCVAQSESLAAGDVDSYSAERRCIRPDGGVVWLQVTASLQRNERGQPQSFIKVVQDISEKKRAQESLEDANALLEERVRHATRQVEARARRLQEMTLELTDAEQRERRRLAQYLHDNLQQLLVAAKMQVEMVRRTAGDEKVAAAVGKARDLIVESIQASRSLTFDLSPPVLYDHGLCAALEWLQDQMRQKHRFEVDVHLSGDDGSLCESIKVFLFTAIRELLFNVRKHAGVDQATVRVICKQDVVHVEVEDWGHGFDVAVLDGQSNSGGGFGLFSIQERIGLLGGKFRIHSTPGRGSRFTLRAPMDGGGLSRSEQVELGLTIERTQGAGPGDNGARS